MDKPLVSIITVVYNGEKYLERTIQSVVNHAPTEFEYIVIDGASKDRTLDIIKKYSSQIHVWISEPDQGLYDAMNKGLKLAKGELVWFLNAGDQIYSSIVTKTILELGTKHDIYYGETLVVDEFENTIGNRRLKSPKVLNWKSFRNGMVVCHQSIIIKKTITGPYLTKYRVAADFQWVLESLKKTNNIYNLNQYVCKFLDGGINKQKIPQGLKERFLIMVHYYGLFLTIVYHFPIAFRFFLFWILNKRF